MTRPQTDLMRVRALMDIAINAPGNGWLSYAETACGLLKQVVHDPDWEARRKLYDPRELTEEEKQRPDIKEMLEFVAEAREQQRQEDERAKKMLTPHPSSKESHDRLMQEAQQ